tara:strand:- start:26 stop:208 length:183 start_codon:yes stop_codon:yes gene_type:complete
MNTANKYYKHRALERAKYHLDLNNEWGRIPFNDKVNKDDNKVIIDHKLPKFINKKDDFKE